MFYNKVIFTNTKKYSKIFSTNSRIYEKTKMVHKILLAKYLSNQISLYIDFP